MMKRGDVSTVTTVNQPYRSLFSGDPENNYIVNIKPKQENDMAGRPKKVDNPRIFNLIVNEDVLKQLRQIAVDTDRTVADITRTLMDEFIAKNKLNADNDHIVP